jgi:ElaB/YqjD/DUF883 family membrane-anchored ribosome-binding protein
MNMERAMDDFDKAKGKIKGDIRNVLTDGEDLLKAAAAVSGESFAAAQTKIEERLANARTSLAQATQPVIDGTKKNAALADKYARENPWTVIGIAAAAGLLIGLLAARR